ncbi:helix-turn-helix transcriptional regulator [Terasakiella pusilla]|uniref:helix-turn-helix transcriptional regulator n=1 Tax=Terasakiella pusilla TaxID=64973 RepID=UPI003AA9BA23
MTKRFRVKDAATYCGLSVSTLNKYRVTGAGPVFHKLGRVVLYDIADLDAWLESCKRRSTSEYC